VPSRARKACVEGPVLVVERTIDLNAVDNFQVDTRVVVVQSVGIAEVGLVAVDPDMGHKVVVD
jgi:hypothetical protein